MENKLKRLFDYQRFEQNERLEQLIGETESRLAVALSDEDLSFVNAAGTAGIKPLTGDFIGNSAESDHLK